MSGATREAYSYLRYLGVHPPRRHKEARALARRLRAEAGPGHILVGWMAEQGTLEAHDRRRPS